MPRRQLVVLRFGPGANFEGELLGALERIETGMSLRVADVLFIRRAADTGEIEALAVGANEVGTVAAAVLDFRLDPESRRERSTQTLARDPDLVTLGDALEPGHALAAVLLEHRWAKALDDASEWEAIHPSSILSRRTG